MKFLDALPFPCPPAVSEMMALQLSAFLARHAPGTDRNIPSWKQLAREPWSAGHRAHPLECRVEVGAKNRIEVRGRSGKPATPRVAFVELIAT